MRRWLQRRACRWANQHLVDLLAETEAERVAALNARDAAQASTIDIVAALDQTRGELGDLQEAFRRLAAIHDTTNHTPNRTTEMLTGPGTDHHSTIVQAAQRALTRPQ